MWEPAFDAGSRWSAVHCNNAAAPRFSEGYDASYIIANKRIILVVTVRCLLYTVYSVEVCLWRNIMNTIVVGREESLKDLRERVALANMRDDELFHDIFREAKFLLELSDTNISEALLVSRPTVNRWANGRNLPHPAMRKPIFDWIREELSQRIKRLSAPRQYAAI
jgi:hypothetical protein